MASEAPTAYALALQFALLPAAEQRRHASARLAALAREGGYRIGTGFVGTPLILDALCDGGAYDAAYRLLTQRACPSWLYPVTMGATTIWERWDSLLPDGRVNPGEMTSFNHYALGAVADWLHRVVGGLAPAEPGYRRLEVCPRPGGGLTYASARHRTPYGLASCVWRIAEGVMTVEVVVPPNATARVTLPGQDGKPLEVGSGTHHWAYSYSKGDTRARRPPLSLDSTLVDLYDDAAAWEAAVQAVPDLAGQEVGLQGRGNMSLRRVVSRLPHPGEAGTALEATLAGRAH